MGKGSKAPSGPQEVIQTSSNIPEYARPFYEEMLGRTAYESTRPYEAYPGQRLHDFTAYEQAGMRGMGEMAGAGAPQQMGMASDIASQIGYQPSSMGMQIARGFDPQQVQSGYRAADITPGYQAGYLGQGYRAGQRQPGYEAGTFDPGYEAGDVSQDYQAGDLGVDYKAGTFDPGYDAGTLGQDYTAGELTSQYTGTGQPGTQQFGSGFEAGTVADADTIQDYMNPYQQLVTDIEKREATRQSEIQGSGIGQQAAQAGGLGGYREAIMQAERERNLGQQLADIQTKGGQAAFQQAQQAFEADRQARLAEGQLGLETGTAREAALQQAEQYRQGAFGTTQQAQQAQQQMETQAYQAGESAKQEAARLGLSAEQQEDAARQAQEQFKQSAFQQTESGRQQQQQFQTQVFQAGEQARQRAAEMGMNAQQQEDAARQAQEQFGQSQFQTNEQMRQAEQQANVAAYQAQEQARQEGARLGLSAQEIEERGRQAANTAYMRAQEFNVGSAETAARLGLAGLGEDRATRGMQLDAARLLGTLGGQDQRMAYERLRNMQAAGQIQRQLGQQGMDIGYQDFLRQQAFPREQLALYNAMLQGLPIQPGSTTATYGGPSNTQQMLGAGIGGVGLYRALMGGG